MRTKLSRLKPTKHVEFCTPGVSTMIFLDVLRNRSRSFERSAIGQLHIDIRVALIFIGKKARGTRLEKNPAAMPNRSNRSAANSAFPHQHAAPTHIAIRQPFEQAIEAIEESLQKPRTAVRGRSSRAASAGLSVSALNADSKTEMAIVTANC